MHSHRERLSHLEGGNYAGDASSPRAVLAESVCSHMDYYDKAISFEGLYRATRKICRDVRWKDSVVGYENNSLRNTLTLRNELKAGTHKIRKYQVFTIHEPKERVVAATRLPDRQFQRALCDTGLYHDITEHLIRDNVACQKGRGTDDALRRMKLHLRQHYRKHGIDGWVLKCDVHHFFPSTRHDVAKAAVQKYVSDQRAAEAVCKVIDSFGGNVGIGLGSEISQLVELLVLNDLDHYIKERLHIRHYVRYMDDFILIHQDKEYLQFCRKKITEKLQAIGLELNQKTSLFQLRQGVVYLKWRFVLTETGKVLMLMDGSAFSRQRRRMRKLWAKECAGQVNAGTTRTSLQAFLANAERGDTYRQCNKIKQYYRELTGRQYDMTEEYHKKKLLEHAAATAIESQERLENVEEALDLLLSGATE